MPSGGVRGTRYMKYMLNPVWLSVLKSNQGGWHIVKLQTV
jgi:hypothetical protein